MARRDGGLLSRRGRTCICGGVRSGGEEVMGRVGTVLLRWWLLGVHV